MKSGTALQRAALGLNIKAADPGVATQGPVEPVKGAGARLMKHLKFETLLKLRDVALEASRLPPGPLDPERN